MVTITRFFKSAIYALLAFAIPRHMKRIMFIMALYQSTIKGEELTYKDLVELNDALKLAKTNPAALRFPAKLAKGNFLGLTCKSICDVSEDEISQLLEKLPSWMRYARSDDLKKDVLKLRKYSVQHA